MFLTMLGFLRFNTAAIAGVLDLLQGFRVVYGKSLSFFLSLGTCCQIVWLTSIVTADLTSV